MTRLQKAIGEPDAAARVCRLLDYLHELEHDADRDVEADHHIEKVRYELGVAMDQWRATVRLPRRGELPVPYSWAALNMCEALAESEEDAKKNLRAAEQDRDEANREEEEVRDKLASSEGRRKSAAEGLRKIARELEIA